MKKRNFVKEDGVYVDTISGKEIYDCIITDLFLDDTSEIEGYKAERCQSELLLSEYKEYYKDAKVDLYIEGEKYA